EAEVVVDRADAVDEVDAVLADIVEAPEEGRDEERTGLRDEHRLHRLEAERHVRHDALVGQRLARLQPVDGARELDDDVLRDLCALVALLHHRLDLGRDDLRRDGAFVELADLGEALAVVDLLLRDERGVGRHTVEHAEVARFADLVEVGGVDVDVHGVRSNRRGEGRSPRDGRAGCILCARAAAFRGKGARPPGQLLRSRTMFSATLRMAATTMTWTIGWLKGEGARVLSCWISACACWTCWSTALSDSLFPPPTSERPAWTGFSPLRTARRSSSRSLTF